MPFNYKQGINSSAEGGREDTGDGQSDRPLECSDNSQCCHHVTNQLSCMKMDRKTATCVWHSHEKRIQAVSSRRNKTAPSSGPSAVFILLIIDAVLCTEDIASSVLTAKLRGDCGPWNPRHKLLQNLCCAPNVLMTGK